MPTYCFSCDECGKTYEEFGCSDCPPQEVECVCGKNATRDFRLEHCGKQVSCDWYRDNVSHTMGCIPEQAPELREAFAPHGVKVNRDGNVIIDSPQAKKRAMRAMKHIRGSEWHD